ncbi:hypothetical protein [Kribbella sp. NBC_00359]|uniref:hypothetical protein n=1 Tax=Kribbella sp. NBC_00359 TaxID=2975966 RepID=UPI002E221CDB
MNILIPLLQEGQSAVADLMYGPERGSDGDRLELGDLLANDAFPVPARIRDQRESRSPDIQRALSLGYVPILDTSSWDYAVEETRTRPPVHAHRWVTFVAVSPVRGVSAPDDDSPREELTAFVDLPGGTTTMSIPLAGPPVVEMLEARHCALPSRGLCAPGCGSCAIREVLGPRSGLVCMCDHDGQAG